MYYEAGYNRAPNLSDFHNPQSVAKPQLGSGNPSCCHYSMSQNHFTPESYIRFNSPSKNNFPKGSSTPQITTTQPYRPDSFTALYQHAQNLEERTALARLESEGLQLMLLKQYLKTTSFQLKQFKQITDLSKEYSKNDYSNPIQAMRNLRREIEDIGTNHFQKYCPLFYKPSEVSAIAKKRSSLDSNKFTDFRAQSGTQQIHNTLDESSQTGKQVSFYDQLLVEPQEQPLLKNGSFQD